MKNLLKTSILTLTLAVFVLSPFGASADSNGKNKSEKEREKIEKRLEKIENKTTKENKRCWNTFFYRMMPFSWVKANLDNIDLDNECYKSTPKATTTPDTTSPIISNILSRTGQKRALIVWNTNEKATAKIYYSTSSPVNLSTASQTSLNSKRIGGKDHYILINNLAPTTTYYAIIEAKDKAGNTAHSGEFVFTTKSGSIIADTTAPTISSIGSTVSTSSINVSWNTNEVATSKVYYATSTPINTSTANFVLSGSLVTNHNLKIENLSTSTLFYLMIESVDSATNTATSSNFTATTTAP